MGMTTIHQYMGGQNIRKQQDIGEKIQIKRGSKTWGGEGTSGQLDMGGKKIE